jgi:hypothetical protein
MGLRSVHLMPLTPQKHMQPPPYGDCKQSPTGQWIPEPAPGLGQFFQPLPQHRVILQDYFIPHGHPATADHPARPPASADCFAIACRAMVSLLS